jgi:hypothetical protein
MRSHFVSHVDLVNVFSALLTSELSGFSGRRLTLSRCLLQLEFV